MKDYKKIALYDLINRSEKSIPLYLLLWLIISLPTQLYASSARFFYLNILIFIILIISRMAFVLFIKQSTTVKISSLLNLFIIVTIGVGVHWGLMTGWILYNDEYAKLQYLILIITLGLAIGASLSLSISNTIRVVFPTVILLPGLIVLFLSGSLQNYIIVFLGVLSWIYIVLIGTDLHNNYWDLIKARVIAEERANVLEKISLTDTLTQINNRLFFNQRLNRDWKDNKQHKTPLTLFILDLDYFKRINDVYGHKFGDEYLQVVASTLNRTIHREEDSLARYGGEEFVFILPNTDSEGAKKIAIDLLKAIEEIKINHEGEAVHLTCSIGGSTIIPTNNKKQDSLLKRADDALYRAKAKGRNQYYSINK